ncbi:MAG: ATP-binding protein, partial [Candidatus Nitrosopolaris sp.]
SATEELLLVFATTGAFTRQKKMGVIELCIEAAKDRNVKIRILMPAHESSEQTVENLRQNYPEQINIRYIEQTSGTKATILLVDRRFSLVMELRDDSTGTFDDAIGLSTYSNSRSGVLSYVSIFKNLWIQTELYARVKQANEQLASANERLKLHDRMQQEFINVAAHELRTPVQPILSIVGVLRSTKGNIDKDKLDNSIDLIDRNAKRLKRLTEDLLDATKIESQSLKLNKEVLNLSELISSAIQDIKNQIEDRSVRVLYEPKREDIIFLEADRHRIVQVVTNLLSNAVKFTKGHGGTVSISTEKKKGYDDDNPEAALVCVKDNGSGIDGDIFPRLFEKFATKSFQGTGLGLFICKGIVNAHHGKIWAENNADGEGKGATFYFTLPIVKDGPGAITKNNSKMS